MSESVVVMIMSKPQAVMVEESDTANEKGQYFYAILASYEGGDPIGWGDTPEDAIEDLKAEIEWRTESA